MKKQQSHHGENKEVESNNTTLIALFATKLSLDDASNALVYLPVVESPLSTSFCSKNDPLKHSKDAKSTKDQDK